MNYVCFLDDPTDFEGVVAENALFVFQANEWTLAQIILQTVVVEEVLKLARLQAFWIDMDDFNQVSEDNIQPEPLIFDHGLAHGDRWNRHAQKLA